MDITFDTGEGRFNYRVCAILLDGDRVLAMHDERSPYYYLPGGRVRMGERAEDAVLREVQEELGVSHTDLLARGGQIHPAGGAPHPRV